ncbi:zwei Ig domain protein zig-8 [Eurytemora carolleeae]|uniref:zwei Ig domain protein zig-8 n=1 Tax=Eurytemora carolleeae TaxID=1294199 RepID=UPI000C78CCD0|nr:zwei Ig domain protein zig-8 [Eurytemora carolleeae]|eukprot:XP_023326142.1 zwei Ig domain protein zig-8-like [Eurytemora affinis]
MKMHCVVFVLSVSSVGILSGSALRDSRTGSMFRDSKHGSGYGVKTHFGQAPNVTKVQVDSPAFLHCPIVDLTDDIQVSWVRRRDWHIMSHEEQTFSSDDRVQVKHQQEEKDWVLQIKFVQQRDSGLYECQVTTDDGSVISRQVQLDVVTPEALILGKEEYHIQQGSLISLICILENSLLPPDYVFWYQNDKMINFDSNRGVSVQTTTGRKTSSKLNIKSARPEHSGNYTCKPSSAVPASIQVFVLGDQTQAVINSALVLRYSQILLFVLASLR